MKKEGNCLSRRRVLPSFFMHLADFAGLRVPAPETEPQKRILLTLVVGKLSLLFTHHCPARCFGMNMPKSRDIQAKIPLPQAIWNEFGLRYCERSEQ